MSQNIDIKYINTSELIPYVNNARVHSESQVKQIAASIQEFGFNNPILCDGKKGVIAGHGRLMAAQKLGIESVPVVELSHLSKAQKNAYILADNRLAELATWDMDLVNVDLSELMESGFNVELTGFDADFLNSVNGDSGSNLNDDKYTTKTDIFTYEPTGDKPDINTLFDMKKAKELISQIDKSELSEDEKEFLKISSYRHVVFNFQEIANYYAHSEKQIQELMEKNALVIIDYRDAISGGFVQLTKELQALEVENEG